MPIRTAASPLTSTNGPSKAPKRQPRSAVTVVVVCVVVDEVAVLVVAVVVVFVAVEVVAVVDDADVVVCVIVDVVVHLSESAKLFTFLAWSKRSMLVYRRQRIFFAVKSNPPQLGTARQSVPQSSKVGTPMVVLRATSGDPRLSSNGPSKRDIWQSNGTVTVVDVTLIVVAVMVVVVVDAVVELVVMLVEVVELLTLVVLVDTVVVVRVALEVVLVKVVLDTVVLVTVFVELVTLVVVEEIVVVVVVVVQRSELL